VAIELRAATPGDVEALAAMQDAQDIAWWGAPDGDVDDVRSELDRVRFAHGSLADGSRIALVGGRAVGSVLLTGHGRADLAVDPGAPDVDEVRRLLVDWAVAAGASMMESPVQDRERVAALEAAGFVPVRSSFELERAAGPDDLGPGEWPPGIAPSPFRPGVDDEELHTMIYSVWMDVPGHTFRPLEEWRALFVDDASFDPELAVVARRDDGNGAIAGCAMSRIFLGTVGWVSQLAVGRPDRGLGLGRSLLVEAFHRLAARDVEILGLGVEAENDTALGLYRSVGLEVTREFVHCARS
jgi:ribosomal protein S18 acetylase RimI-like enzyme